MTDYETFEHGADVGIRGFGRTVEEAFQNGAKAMFSVMVDLDTVKADHSVEVHCEAGDTEELFVEWLNELLALMGIEEMVFCEFKVEINGNKLIGTANGEIFDPQKHHAKTEVKAATYSNLKVERKDDRWMAQCIVDV